MPSLSFFVLVFLFGISWIAIVAAQQDADCTPSTNYFCVDFVPCWTSSSGCYSFRTVDHPEGIIHPTLELISNTVYTFKAARGAFTSHPFSIYFPGTPAGGNVLRSNGDVIEVLFPPPLEGQWNYGCDFHSATEHGLIHVRPFSNDPLTSTTTTDPPSTTRQTTTTNHATTSTTRTTTTRDPTSTTENRSTVRSTTSTRSSWMPSTTTRWATVTPTTSTLPRTPTTPRPTCDCGTSTATPTTTPITSTISSTTPTTSPTTTTTSTTSRPVSTTHSPSSSVCYVVFSFVGVNDSNRASSAPLHWDQAVQEFSERFSIVPQSLNGSDFFYSFSTEDGAMEFIAFMIGRFDAQRTGSISAWKFLIDNNNHQAQPWIVI